MATTDSLDQLVRSAYTQLLCEKGSSVDSILASPELRRLFLEVTGHGTGSAQEEAILRRLLALRKRRGLPTK